AFRFEERYLRDADLGELAAELNEHLADPEIRAGELTAHRCGLAALGVRRAALQEDQTELADLDLVAAAQRRFLYPLPVHVGAIQAADIAHGESAPVPVELGVPPGNRDVVKED